MENDCFDDGHDATFALEREVRDAISDMLSSHDEHVMTIACPTQVSPTIQFVGRTIYKSRLVSQLNNIPFSSKDRSPR